MISHSEIELMSFEEAASFIPSSEFVMDIETYANYWCVAFKCLDNGKFIIFEKYEGKELDNRLRYMMWRYVTIGFNSTNYDIPMLELALAGADNTTLMEASNFIVKGHTELGVKKVTPFHFQNRYNIKISQYNHIDLFNVCPVNGGLTANPASLKLYAGRLHTPTMRELPYPAGATLTNWEIQNVREYCCNDLSNTELVYRELSSEIKLRIDMSKQFDTADLRSKSDAQIAETIINTELKKVLGQWPQKPQVDLSQVLRYSLPTFIWFQTPALQRVLATVCEAEFFLDNLGSPIMPKPIEDLQVQIGKSVYRLGMGGLHSSEKSIAYVANEDTIIADNDVASFYPRTILNQKLYPKHLGEAFLTVYQSIVDKRLEAKKRAANEPHWKTIAESLKITINGSFGKLGNRYSTLYAPQLLLQVTITGQLVLLMLIEALELIGIEVISGNTDGVILHYPKQRHNEVRALIAAWEAHTSYQTEETRYRAIYSRDVNSYVAVKEKSDKPNSKYLDERLGCKTKGAYCERGSSLNSILSKNPEAQVCIDAVLHYLVNETPIERTIKQCCDFRRFVCVRNVKGGGQKDGQYLGKVVRWYYAKSEGGFIAYKESGNKVAKTDNAKPAMSLPSEFPTDIHYDWYIKEAISLLYDCGRFSRPKTATLELL